MKRETTDVALVTGGSRGLGRAICKALASSGHLVIVNYGHNQELANETVDDIRKNGGRAEALQADVTDEVAVSNLVSDIERSYGKISVLVNNATGPQPMLSIEESTWADYLDQLHFFVKAPLLLVKAVAPAMKASNYGRIIMVGSEVVQLGNAEFANYVTAKSAMVGMTRSFARELGPYGITVNLVAPGFIPVERHRGEDASVIESYAKAVPLGHVGEPWDIGEAVRFLAGVQSRFITGQVLTVNGGNTFGI